MNCVSDIVSGFAFNFTRDGEPAFALDHGHKKSLVIAADDGIHFPMPDLQPILHAWATLFDAHAIWAAPTAIATACIPFAPLFLAP